MLITATEFKTNIGKYLSMVDEEEIIITKNGKKIAKLTPATEDKMKTVKALFGILPSNASIEKAREERLSKDERID